MFKNTNAKAAKAKGTPVQGNNYPLANMPANNVGEFKLKLGGGQSSKFGQGVKPATAQKGASQKGGTKAKMPANNITDKKVALGHTKHAVGEVPGYLKGGK
jgi:hypothetical protein